MRKTCRAGVAQPVASVPFDVQTTPLNEQRIMFTSSRTSTDSSLNRLTNRDVAPGRSGVE